MESDLSLQPAGIKTVLPASEPLYFRNACSAVTYTKGIAVLNNPQLSNFTAPMLFDNEGGFHIIANDKLGGVLSFPTLKTIRGALNVTGAFSG